MKTLYSIITLMILNLAFTACQPKLYVEEEPNVKAIEINIEPEGVVKLPNHLDESSALLVHGDDFVTVNDSGGKPNLYYFSIDGAMVKTEIVPGAKNVDWESLTMVGETIYIGDFGNNLGNRKDLTVYTFGEENKPSLEFEYELQDSFAIRNRSNEYDGEALFTMNNEIYVLSKDWVGLNTNLYHLEQKEGKQTVKPMASFAADMLVTGADYDDERELLICVGYKDFENYLLVFPEFTKDAPFTRKPIRILLKDLLYAQCEGVAIKGDDVFFTTEKTRLFQHQLFKISLDQEPLSTYIQ